MPFTRRSPSTKTSRRRTLEVSKANGNWGPSCFASAATEESRPDNGVLVDKISHDMWWKRSQIRVIPEQAMIDPVAHVSGSEVS